MRNAARTSRFAVMGLNAGYSLYDAQRPGATGVSDGRFREEMPELEEMTEIQRNDYLRRRAIAQMKRDPGRVLRLAVAKFLYTWSPVPHAEGYTTWMHRSIAIGWFVPVLLLALGGIWAWRGRRGEVALLLIPVAYFSLVHMVFVGSVRYRLPAMVCVEVLAAAGIAAWADRRPRSEGRS